jgi:hypothetical protein
VPLADYEPSLLLFVGQILALGPGRWLNMNGYCLLEVLLKSGNFCIVLNAFVFSRFDSPAQSLVFRIVERAPGVH